MRRSLAAASALLALAALNGCHKAPPPPVVIPTRTPTPAPITDIVAFTRLGSIWITRSDGAGISLLASPGAKQDFWFPAPTADHSGVLAWLSRDDGTQDVVRIDLSGKVSVLTETGELASPPMKSVTLGNAPSGSPDGKHIVYAFNGNLWIMDSAGYDAETLVNDGASWSPAYSPDGKQIAYVNGKDGHYDLWIADVESRDTYQVTDFSEYSVGCPRWSPSGERILLTRTQGESSDIVEVAAKTDTPAADADVLTKDHSSASAVFSPNGTSILFSSARVMDSPASDLYVADGTGSNAKKITDGGGFSPVWFMPSTASAASQVAIVSRPTPTPPPAAAPRPSPIPTLPPVASVPAAPSAPAAPSSSSAAAPAPAAGAAPAKAVVMNLRVTASFDPKGKLDPVSLANLRKTAGRISQYAGEPVTVIGPSDNSPLKGRYASPEERSRARAREVASELGRLASLDPGTVKAQPYSPPSASSQGGIKIYVVLR